MAVDGDRGYGVMGIQMREKRACKWALMIVPGES